MGFLTGIWTWLTKAARRRTGSGNPDLYPIDVESLAEELNLLTEARRLGEAGLPASDARVLTGAEAAVVQRVEKARQDYVNWAVVRLNVLSEDLGRRRVTQDVNRARQADREFERKASAVLTEQESALRGLGDAAKRAKADLASYKAKHGLTRDAHYPTITGSVLRYGILGFLIVIEGILNAVFFAQGMDSGLIGGFVFAGVLAAINVVIAFVFGKFVVNHVNHVSLGWRLLGLFGTLAAIAVLLAMGFGIAHFRDSLTAGTFEPAKAALQSLITSPLGLQDMFSWALCFISIAFGLASLFDGLFSDDLYPRYGATDRRTQLRVGDYEDELDALRAELEELKNEELTALDKTVRESVASVAVFESLIDDKRMACSRLDKAMRDADNSLEALLFKFRTENELYRAGLSRPLYFDVLPELRSLQMPDFSMGNDAASLADQRQLVELLLADVETVRARIQAAFNQQFDRLQTLDAHFPGKEVT